MTASTVSSSVEVPAVTPTLRASRNHAGSSSSGLSICSVRRPRERAFWASWRVLLLLRPPMTTMWSQWRIRSSMAVWRCLVGWQIVSMKRTSEPR